MRNKNNAVDIFELVEGAYFEPYAGYSFKINIYQNMNMDIMITIYHWRNTLFAFNCRSNYSLMKTYGNCTNTSWIGLTFPTLLLI